MDIWSDPKLFVSQACGLDLFLANAAIEPIAAPVFDLDCKAGMYFSYIVGDLSGSIAAVNSLSSRSGWSALLSECIPEKAVVTGSHQASIKALKTGVADVAAIDAVTWSIIERDEPSKLEGLEIVGRSSEAPSPPYVVRQGVAYEMIFNALQAAFASPDSVKAKNALCVKSVTRVQRADYLPVFAEYEQLRKSVLYDEKIDFEYAD